jgi:hypothetical protein
MLLPTPLLQTMTIEHKMPTQQFHLQMKQLLQRKPLTE